MEGNDPGAAQEAVVAGIGAFASESLTGGSLGTSTGGAIGSAIGAGLFEGTTAIVASELFGLVGELVGGQVTGDFGKDCQCSEDQ